jgi:predicted DNA-binding transcriptional regulator AlpA
MPSNPSTAFSAEIRAYLARHKKNYAEIAHLLGVSEATIYRRLNENSTWPLDDAMAVAEWSGIPLSTLLASTRKGHVA